MLNSLIHNWNKKNFTIYLLGDLAEVAVLQAPQYKMDVNIGMSEEWNNTYIPSVLYFSNVRYSMIKQHNWQITNAEILGGIDGNFIF